MKRERKHLLVLSLRYMAGENIKVQFHPFESAAHRLCVTHKNYCCHCKTGYVMMRLNVLHLIFSTICFSILHFYDYK